MVQDNNPPAVVLPLSEDMVKFLIDNCDANIEFGLKILTKAQAGEVSMEAAQKVVEAQQKFRELKRLITQAQIDR